MKKTFFNLKTSGFLMLLVALVIAGCSQESLEPQTEESTELSFELSSDVTSVSGSSPTTIQAENYDSMSGVRTENTADSGGGQNVGWINSGDYMEYDLNVSTSGSYKFQFRVASKNNNSKFDFYQDNTKLSNVNKASTGGWQSWVTTSKTVNLSSGSSTLKILATGSGWNINWIRITPQDIDENPTTDCDLPYSEGTKTIRSTTLNYSKTIDISCSDSVTISFDAEGAGNMESADYFNFYYKVDGGSQKTIYSKTDSFSQRSFSESGINGNSLQLIISAKTSATNEIYTVSNLKVTGGDDNPQPPTGDYPYDFLGLDDWKITLPRSNDGDNISDEVYITASKNDDSSDPSLRVYEDEFFYVSNDGVRFECPAIYNLPKTSAGTSNTRTELREMPNNDNEAGWSGSGSTVRELEFSARVLQTSSTKKVAFAQIHDYQESNWDDLIRVQIQSDNSKAGVGDFGKIYIMGDMAEGLSSEGVPTQTSSERTIIENYRLGDWMDIRITYNNNTIRIYVDGSLKQTYTGATSARNYFKAGAYNQSMNSSSSGTSIVEFRSLSVTENF